MYASLLMAAVGFFITFLLHVVLHSLSTARTEKEYLKAHIDYVSQEVNEIVNQREVKCGYCDSWNIKEDTASRYTCYSCGGNLN